MPVRTCAGCKKHAEKRELVRIVITPEGATVDSAGTREGRGGYVCPRGTCLRAAIKTGGLARALKQKNVTGVSGFDDIDDAREGSS